MSSSTENVCAQHKISAANRYRRKKTSPSPVPNPEDPLAAE